MAKTTKYIFVTGGVLSGLGKGITAASIGNLLKARGLTVNLQKCDPYLNVDAGLLNPREHGECFVTKDGAETDLDLGHYERFTDTEMTAESSLMSGRVLRQVIDDERNGKYDGQTVQVVPHVTRAIQDHIEAAGSKYDIHIIEIGGTIGDYESINFVEAIREFPQRVGRANCLYVHVVYMPYLGASQEMKTKPAQNSIRELRSLGIAADILVARSETEASLNARRKLSLFSGLPEEAIALLPNAKSIYEVPLTLESSGVASVIAGKLGVKTKPKLATWRDVVARATTNYPRTVSVGLVAKYLDNADTYLCVIEALKSAAWWNDTNIDIRWIDAEKLETINDAETTLASVDGIVVPGGFGPRGFEGKVLAASRALASNQPYLGLCLGLHAAVVAAARAGGLKKANSAEFDKAANDPVIATMEGQKGLENTGGTMRLGDYDCTLTSDSLAAGTYKATEIIERHRHRYECNPKYIADYEKWGIRAVGHNPQTKLVEVIEGKSHPYFIASQFHPEFKSRPNRPHPLFDGFIKASLKLQKKPK